MRAERISLISMDLDGTLLGMDQKISPENRDTLAECAGKGIRLALSSGRSFESTRTFATAMGIDCAIISCNGARVDASQAGGTLMEDCVPAHTARALFDELCRSAIYFECYTPGRIYMTSGFVERFHSHEQRVVDLDGHKLEYIDGTERMREEALDHAYKFVVFSPDAQTLGRVGEAIATGGLPVDVTSSWYDNIEIMNRGAGKGRAVKRLAEIYGIPKEEIMSFGDNMNDLSMLEVSGWPVAMENAVDELKARARVIAPHHDLSGVAKAIRKYVAGMEGTV